MTLMLLPGNHRLTNESKEVSETTNENWTKERILEKCIQTYGCWNALSEEEKNMTVENIKSFTNQNIPVWNNPREAFSCNCSKTYVGPDGHPTGVKINSYKDVITCPGCGDKLA